jgi:hypothetical protein
MGYRPRSVLLLDVGRNSFLYPLKIINIYNRNDMNQTKRVLTSFEVQSVSGGDRWGDGRDELNHPDKSSLAEYCEPLPGGVPAEMCIVYRYKKVN